MQLPNWRPAPRSVLAAALLTTSLAVVLAASPACAVTITIKNTDGFQEGFNDPKPVAPVGGNPGTTLGAQRRFLFQYAADIWGARLEGDIPIIVTAAFNHLGGNSVSAVLGQAGPETYEKGFPGAPLTQTWYSQALANQLAGVDRNDLQPGACPDPLVAGHCPEIFAEFNSDVDGSVLGSVDFYYGLDGNNGSDLDFLSVLLHEFAHGLGLIDLIDNETGRITPNPNGDTCQSCNDAYTNNLEDPKFTPNKKLSLMTNNQRLQAIVDDSKLVWTGAAAVAASDTLTAGVRADGAIQIYAPTTYLAGSSVHHVDTDVAPNELMEPFSFNPPPRDLTITLALLKDLGWDLVALQRCGDANDDSKVTTADALQVLRASVNPNAECPELVCNVNSTGGITTSDALLLLKFSVGQGVALHCPLA